LPKSVCQWGGPNLIYFFLITRKEKETHHIVRVDVLDYDSLGRQLGRETFGPSSEERLAGGVDGEHWGWRCACK
jgi:hypothetical protein